MKSIWIVAADVPSLNRVYLPEYAAMTKTESLQKVLARARSEGFMGSAQQRLDALGWEVVRVRIEEIPGD